MNMISSVQSSQSLRFVFSFSNFTMGGKAKCACIKLTQRRISLPLFLHSYHDPHTYSRCKVSDVAVLGCVCWWWCSGYKTPYFLYFSCSTLVSKRPTRGVQPFGVSGSHWKKNCLGPHIKYTNTNENWWAKKGLGIIFMISTTADKSKSSHMWPLGRRLDTLNWGLHEGCEDGLRAGGGGHYVVHFSTI